MSRASPNALLRMMLVAATACTVTFGSVRAVASTSTSQPTNPAATGDIGDESALSTATMTGDGGTEPPSPEAAAFCQAELAAEAAANSADPSLIGPAFDAVVAAAPEEIVLVVEEVVAAAEREDFGPTFTESYNVMLDYMRANCGFAILHLTASDFAFGGLPPELAAGPAILYLENLGEEVHEIRIFRIHDDIAITADELLALPEGEADAMVTFVGGTFVVPGDIGNTVVDLKAGRYLAVCFVPEGARPEVIEQLEGSDTSLPEDVELGAPHFTLGMFQEFQVR